MSDTTGTVHELKTWPDYWIALERGAKNFEVRRNDRSFQPGDVLVLREWNPHSKEYTGRSLRRRINYVLRDAERFGLAEGFVVLGIGPDTTGQTPARDEMVKAGAEAILRYMGEWGTDDDSTEAKAHELGQWVLDAALAGRTVVELPEPDKHGDYDNDYATVWPMLDGRVSWGNGSLSPAVARSFALALLAATNDAERRLASESSGDGVVAISRDDLQRAVWSGQMTQQQVDDLLVESGQDGEPCPS